MEVQEFELIGLSLPAKTSNINQQAMIDCGNLWQQFETENIIASIPNKLSEEIFAVYHNYDGDYTQPYAYFIGCKVEKGTVATKGLSQLTIPQNTYQKIIAKGKMPDCVANAWIEIWNTDLPRVYAPDFEVYDEQSKDWNNATVSIYLSVKS
ncbi:GyrI-like domain-containing protein [Pedobacter sp. Hv1]|uniref:GyrI-like domain-containing protein n=1 Tax=Pedobacter sp. Hv1 TaxID=1740090 RepID=UPI0006D8BA17|nr:effector binding domain-containing protein [Pedobacter sp. Hv1]KQC02580.1 transcriptional regulator [Pedobacter sp. Hv1]